MDIFDLEKVNYYLYRDDSFLRSIFSQIKAEPLDLGIIEYRGTNTHLYTKEIKGFGEEEHEFLERNTNDNEVTEKNLKKILSELRFSDTDGTNIMREYANIEEIKKINVESLYKKYIKEVKKKSDFGDENIIQIRGKIKAYDTESYIEKFNKTPSDIFANIDNQYCIWLKSQFLDTEISIMSNIFQEVNIIGYVVSNETNVTPKIVKAIVIYV